MTQPISDATEKEIFVILRGMGTRPLIQNVTSIESVKNRPKKGEYEMTLIIFLKNLWREY